MTEDWFTDFLEVQTDVQGMIPSIPDAKASRGSRCKTFLSNSLDCGSDLKAVNDETEKEVIQPKFNKTNKTKE